MEVAEMREALLLGGVTLPNGQTADVRVEGGKIAAVTAPGGTDLPAEQRQEAVAAASPERVVVHQGRVVCRTALTRELPGRTEAAAVPVHSGSPP
jgi:hypothetical protein